MVSIVPFHPSNPYQPVQVTILGSVADLILGYRDEFARESIQEQTIAPVDHSHAIAQNNDPRTPDRSPPAILPP